MTHEFVKEIGKYSIVNLTKHIISGLNTIIKVTCIHSINKISYFPINQLNSH